MNNLKFLVMGMLALATQHMITLDTTAQETRDLTINVNGRADVNQIYAFGCWDEFTIINATGINWLRVVEDDLIFPVWETSSNILYDGVPIPGRTTKTVKRHPPCEGCGWQCPTVLALVATGQGTLTLRFKQFSGEPPFAIEGEYLDKYDGTYGAMYGTITANPSNLQPGNSTNIEVRLPEKMRRLVSGIVLEFTDAQRQTPNRVTLPFDIDGVYNFTYTVPDDGSFERLNVPMEFPVRFEAISNNPGTNGQNYVITSGITYLKIASTLTVELNIQGRIVQQGSNNTWNNERPRAVGARILNGQGPFTSRWIVNGQEVNLPPEQVPFSTGRSLQDQNVLANAASITFEVTDANGNTASGSIFVGINTDLSFQFMVQGVKVENGATVKWREGSSKLVTINPIYGGKTPLKGKWYINQEEVVSKTLVNRFDQLTEQEFLDKARSITYEVMDANGVVSSGTIYLGDPTASPGGPTDPTGPVGPAPVPPPLTGDPTREPDPTIDWNNKPWLDEKVQQCTHEYLQQIVLHMENEIRKWENTGLPEASQKELFTSIDDWGRLLNPYITATGRVDGNWENPTHYVWYAFNNISTTTRYGRTVEYYVKYECNLLNYNPDDIKSAINDVSNDEENTAWDDQKIRDAQDGLNNLLEIARNLYRLFNLNYQKFVNEINDRNSNPLQNEVIALCLAGAQGQFEDHAYNKDSIDSMGNLLIAQSATNKDIDMFEIIQNLSEVQGQADDMTKKLEEMKTLLLSQGGDIDEIMTTGQLLIAQNNVNPEFAQDGGVNVEFFGDGVDNFGDGLQDYMYGNVRRGNVLIVIWDAGNIADDIFGVALSGKGDLGTTPPGGRRNFDISVSSGAYTLTITGIYTDPNTPPCTYGIQVYDKDNLILQEVNIMDINQQIQYNLIIQ